MTYHDAPAGRAADPPELLLGGEFLVLGTEFCWSNEGQVSKEVHNL